MKRKLIALCTSLMLAIPFVYYVPVYAADTFYWTGDIYTNQTGTVEQDGVNLYKNDAYRLRFNYVPDYTVFCAGLPDSSNIGRIYYYWYIGRYDDPNTPSDVTIFNARLKYQRDHVLSNSTIYTTESTTNGGVSFYIQVGDKYDHYVSVSTGSVSTYPIYGAYLNNAIIVLTGGNTGTATVSSAKSALNVALGYDNNYSRFLNASSVADKQLYDAVSARSGQRSSYLLADNVYTAFNSTVTPPQAGGSGAIPDNGYGDGSGSGSGSGGDSGSGGSGGSSSSSATIEEGAINQTQSQTIESGAVSNTVSPSAVIENDAVNVTVNGDEGMTPEKINALDTLLQNQGVDTSFEQAIQNVNGFRKLGVAFASTVTVFLGWLPSWVVSLLALMFTLLFFFIILRLLKVFHG